MLKQITSDLKRLADPDRAKNLSRFFKTGKGEYGEGDVFLGITVPEQRKIAKKHSAIPLNELRSLLASNVHEHRLTALLILVIQYHGADENSRKDIFDFYVKNMRHVNNWDLVDLSADKILGNYLHDKDKSLIYMLAKSENLWERRIAIIATFQFIKNDSFHDTLQIARILLNDSHDLIHKAVGWMLREVGKRDLPEEERFLSKHYKIMPRTMLRYAIEKFDDKKRKFYLNT